MSLWNLFCLLHNCLILIENTLKHHHTAVCAKLLLNSLTHWGRVMHICFNKLTIIGSDNGLAPIRQQAFIWTNAVILSILTLETKFREILSKIQTLNSRKCISKCRPFCLSLTVLTHWGRDKMATIFQATFWNGFSWMKMYEYLLKFHWNLFLSVKLTIFRHWFR